MKNQSELTKIARNFADDERGATAIEYTLIAAIVGIGLVTSLQNLDTGLTTAINSAGTAVAN